MMPEPDSDSPTMKGVYLWVRNSIVLICFLLICGLVMRGIFMMDDKDRRSREDQWRERELSDRVLAREMERSRVHGNVTGDWIRKGIESHGVKIAALTAKIDALIDKLNGIDVGMELLPMPREIQ